MSNKRISDEHRQAAKARQKAQTKAWAQRNKERMAELSRASEQRNYAARQEYKRQYYLNHKEHILAQTRKNKIKRVYGMTSEEYEQRLEAQGRKCGVSTCGGLVSDALRPNLVVDHCHKTGKVRGLLCNKCNSGIGMLGDTIEALEAAVAYLRRAGV